MVMSLFVLIFILGKRRRKCRDLVSHEIVTFKMPNEESPVDSMEYDCEADQAQIQEQKSVENGVPEIEPEVAAEAQKNLGNAEYAQKNYSKAIEFYTKAIDTFPQASYYGNRAAAYVMLTQFSKALEDARRSTQIDPTFTKGYMREAKCQLALGEVAAAVHLYEKVLEAEPGNAVALSEHKQAKYVQGLLLKSDLSYQKEDFRTVIYNMDRCIEICNYCSKFKVLKAECLASLGRYDEAQNLASDVLRVDGLCADAVYVRGLCLYYTEAYDKAFQHFQQVLRIAPDHAKARDVYRKAKSLKAKKDEGNAAYSKGKYSEAELLYKEALLVDPLNVTSNAKLHYNLATVFSQLRKYDEAVKHCSSAIKLDKNYTKAYVKRAHCYTELEKHEEAVKEYETILKFDRSKEIRVAHEKAKLRLKKSKRKDYYKILGIDKNAGDDEIKKAYRKRALLHHPDRHSSATEEVKKAEEVKFKEIGEAYSVLSDPKKKPLYDSGHDLEEIQNGGASGFDGGIDPNFVFQSFFGGSKAGFSTGGNFQQGGFSSGGFPGFSFHF